MCLDQGRWFGGWPHVYFKVIYDYNSLNTLFNKECAIWLLTYHANGEPICNSNEYILKNGVNLKTFTLLPSMYECSPDPKK